MGEAELNFIIEGAGWARIEISADSVSHTIEGISYLTNALDDLLRMGIDIATDRGWSTALFDHEPRQTVLAAETSWFENGEPFDGARLSSFDAGPTADTITWRQLIDAPRDFALQVGSRDELARIFLKAGERVWDQHGDVGYRKLWGGRLAFPVRAMKALKSALGSPVLPPQNYAT